MKEWEDVELIGVFATKEETQKEFDKTNIIINSNDVIQFFTKIISTAPVSYPEKIKYISCFASAFYDDFIDNKELDHWQRIEAFRSFIEDKYLCLRVNENVDKTYEGKVHYNGMGLKILPKDSSMQRDETLFPIPIFNCNTTKMSFEEFKDTLKRKEPIGNIKHYSKEVDDFPQFLFWESNEGSYYVVGEIQKQKYSEVDGYTYIPTNYFSYYKLDEEDIKNIVNNQDRIAFINIELIQKLEGELNKVSEDKKSVVFDNNTKDEMEDDFLLYFKNRLLEQGLVYSDRDILNFHTSIKSSKLVILSGMSGIGKSKLVTAYADALNLKIDKQFKFISVSPGWTDDSDLIGYADTLNMIYRPSDNELVETLIEASKNTDKLYIVCLDEMNLARVEHYFSQFLSVLEADEKNRTLKLYNQELGNRLYNSEQYKPEIRIRDNVKFVGTVNMDESTFHFSNKVLDRADVINLEIMNFKQLVEASSRKETITLNEGQFQKDYIEKFINTNKQIELDDEIIEFLQELHDLISKFNNQLGIGPRVLKQIDSYMKNIPIIQDAFTRKMGIDLQIVQRVLTKVRGSQEELERLIGTYDKKRDQTQASLIIDLFDDYNNISDFKESRNSIKMKAKELYLNGYTF